MDLVIIDYTMPSLTGIQSTREILEIRPDMSIDFCTGFNEKAANEAARGIGIRELLMKPLNRRQLLDAVRGVLDGAASEMPLSSGPTSPGRSAWHQASSDSPEVRFRPSSS